MECYNKFHCQTVSHLNLPYIISFPIGTTAFTPRPTRHDRFKDKGLLSLQGVHCLWRWRALEPKLNRRGITSRLEAFLNFDRWMLEVMPFDISIISPLSTLFILSPVIAERISSIFDIRPLIAQFIPLPI